MPVTDLTVIPQALTSAAGDLSALGSSLAEANTLAAASTTDVVPAAADEVSAAIAELFSGHGAWWQQLAAQAARFQQEFIQTLAAAANTYSGAEAANTAAVGLGENILSLQTGPGFAATLSSSVPVDLLLRLTNTGLPIVGPWLNAWALAAVGATP